MFFVQYNSIYLQHMLIKDHLSDTPGRVNNVCFNFYIFLSTLKLALLGILFTRTNPSRLNQFVKLVSIDAVLFNVFTAVQNRFHLKALIKKTLLAQMRAKLNRNN